MTILLTSAMALATAPDDACNRSGDRPDLRISVATFGPMGSLRPAAIVEEVDRVWANYGFHFTWRLAATARNTDAGSTPIDVWIQLYRDSPDWRNAYGKTHVLGSVKFENGEPLSVIRIPITPMANAVRDEYRTHGLAFHELFNPHARILERALGRAIAHELGHILLRSSSHTRSGLMRASVGAALFISPDPVDLGLDPAEAARLRTRPGAPGQTCGDGVARK
jgi:hypothetical protein